MASIAQKVDSAHVLDVLRDAKPVIVGGGPCGSFAAALLSSRGIPVTLVEKQPVSIPLEIPRAYQMRIGQRGREALGLIPQLFSELQKNASLLFGSRFIWVGPDGKGGASPLRTIPREIGPDLIVLRHTLVQSLTDFVTKCEGVNALHSSIVTGIRPCADDSFEVDVRRAEGDTETLNTRLVIATDGINSVVAQSLLSALNSQGDSPLPRITTSAGLCSTNFYATNDDICIKSVAVDPDLISILDAMFSKVTSVVMRKDVAAIRVLRGDPRYGGSRVQFIIFPQAPNAQLQKAGVALASITAPRDHDVWKLETVSDAFSFCKCAFPQFDAKKYITEEHMKAFVETHPTEFPDATRRNSLVANLGTAGKAGAIFLGDAAHSHPPSIGQGVNMSFQDAAIFAKIIDCAQGDATVGSILQEYESKRDGDTTALLQMCAMMTVSLGGSKLRLMMYLMDQRFKRILARFIPGMHPSMADLLWTNLPFTEVVRRIKVTTDRLRIGLASLFLVPAIAFVVTKRR